MSAIDTSAVSSLSDDKLEALIEMMVLAASADGEFSAEERAHFEKSVESLTDNRVSKDKAGELLQRAQKELESSGRAARLEAVKQRLPDAGARKVALALAIQVTAADGLIRTSERELIMDTAEALEIDRDEAADLVRDLTS